MVTNVGSCSWRAETLTLTEIGPPAASRSDGASWATVSRTSVSEGADLVGLLGEADEDVGGDVGAVELPADQGLDPGDLAAGGDDHGLVDDPQLAVARWRRRSSSTSSSLRIRACPIAGS